MISKEDRAYCAGLFEGEGNIHSSIRNSTNGTSRQRTIVLSIAMTDLYPLELFNDIIGLGVINGPRQTKAEWKPIYEYRVGRFEVVQFIVCNIWDWLSPRRKEQCEKAFKNYTTFKLTNNPMKLSKNSGDYR